ncbi:Starch-binding associating with outer membrane [Spirosomataceae bacterium TFI 002]|nr:Starch-binding associating with outer membrane [Spirosomataceae bacterium TFI 002]
MNKYKILGVLSFFLLLSTSCQDYLDINTNPNSATSATPDLVLPQAIVGFANISNQFNAYGGHFGGYIANAGGFSGFGNLFNYNLVPANYNGLWVNSYDNLQDLNYVIKETEGKDELAYYNAAATILMAAGYQRLVDTFNDVPYSEALSSDETLIPKYDDASTIYASLFANLDNAIKLIDNAKFPLSLNGSSDPLFAGNMTSWKRFANTLRLRMSLRTDGALTGIDSSIGFLNTDAIVNPGYVKDKPNPLWATWGYTTTGTLSNSSRIPTKFSFGFYDGNKLADAGRGGVIFKSFSVGGTATPVNQLGNEVDNPAIITNYPTWYTGTYSSSSSISNALGVLKGPSQGQVLMLHAESLFLQSEARLRGILTDGDFAADFNAGIKASYTYLYKDVTNVLSPDKDVNADFEAYKLANEGKYLVNISAANGQTEQLEAIITQKYIALNMINSDESWNEYRRTGFPKTDPKGTAYENMAALLSNSTRPDKLPTRVLYPSSEQSYNSSNYKAIDQFSDKIFWDKN